MTVSLVMFEAFADGALGLVFAATGLSTAYRVMRRSDTPYLWQFVLFAAFTGVLGVTYIAGALAAWYPLAIVHAILELVAAVVAIATGVMFVSIIPKLLKLQSPIADVLTALPNRLLFVDRVQSAMARLRRENRDLLAVLFVDIDGFKRVNDSLGHDLGNQLLIRAAKRLTRAVRTADTVARFGGDEFLILLERIDGPLYAKGVARRIISELERPFPFGEVSVQISASVGIALSDGSESAEDLISAADLAMYRAKQRERGTFELFDKTWQPATVAAT